MQRRKGFTLVELVVVIAVIAILLGVMIGTFASVINRANESARLQEMKAQEIEQKANDLLAKLNNADWFGWEDLETKIGESVQTAVAGALNDNKAISETELDKMKTVVTTAVDAAIAKYASSLGQEYTGLTAEQVQYIVEQAVSNKGGVTEPQVKAIVTQAVGSLRDPLSASQVQKIVDAAVTKVTASGLTAADLAAALAPVAKKTELDNAETEILNAIATAQANQSTLTADEVSAIVSKYVNANGTAKGDYSWYSSAATEMVIEQEKAEAQLVALSTLSNGGETFEGKTITISSLFDQASVTPSSSTEPLVITLEEKWNPIKIFAGTLIGTGVEIRNVNFDIVFFTEGDKVSNGTSVYVGGTSNPFISYFGNRNAYGFINDLAGTVKGLTIEYNMTDWCEDPANQYTYVGGIAGNLRPTGVIEDCTVKGTIKAWGRVGGLVGYVRETSKTSVATIKNCSVEDATIYSRVSSVVKHSTGESYTGYTHAAGFIGMVDGLTKIKGTCEIKNVHVGCCTANDGTLITKDTSFDDPGRGKIVRAAKIFVTSNDADSSNYYTIDTGATITLTDVTIDNPVVKEGDGLKSYAYNVDEI